MITRESLDRRIDAARHRNQTFVIHFGKWDGLEFLELMIEVKHETELEPIKKYWKSKWGFDTLRVYDLFYGETQFQRVRRLRKGS